MARSPWLPKVVDALARVHVPLTLSETWTWPLELYWPNYPTSRSPAPTALLNWRVVLVTWVPVLVDAPWTHVAFDGVVRPGW